jgi:hypothetical protein
MKEKLRALWAEKIGPKLEPVFARLREMNDRVLAPANKYLRLFSYFLIIPVVFTFIAGIGFFWIYPAYELRPWMTEKLVTTLKAQSLRVGDMTWAHSLPRFSLGIALKDVEVQGGAWFHDLKLEELKLSFSPFSLVFEGTPFKLEAKGVDADLKFSSPRDADPHAIEEATVTGPAPTKKAEKLAEWVRKLLAYAKGYKVQLRDSRVKFEIPSSDKSVAATRVVLQDMELDAELDASWRQHIRMEANAQAGSSSASWILAGPVEFSSKSVLAVRDGNVPVSLEFSDFEIDLSEANFTGWDVFERFAPGLWKLQAKPRVLFREEEGHFLIGEVISGETSVRLDDLKVELNSRYQPGKEFELHWLVGRSEVKEFHLPLKWIRRAPGVGVISSMGRLHVRDRLDNSDFNWRLALNNFKMDSSYLASLWGDKKSSSGPLILSAVSEGRLQNGRLESPRSEIQIEAGDVNWDPPESIFVKPRGAKARLLVRFSHDSEGLKLTTLDADLHSLNVRGTGSVKNLLGYVLDDEALTVNLDLDTNDVDLSEWTALFPWFRKVPLQGVFEAKASASAVYDPSKEKRWSLSEWNVEKFHFSNVKGSFEKGGVDIAGLRQDLNGPFSVNFFFVGRGDGTRVNRATLLSQVDLSGASIWLSDQFRKPQNVPFLLQISADQSRNRVDISKGRFQFSTLDMSFMGQMIQGAGRSRLKVSLEDPIDLSSWRRYFPDAKLQERVRGRVWLDGSLGLDSNFRSEKDIDWSTLTFDGQMRFEDFAWDSDLLGNAFDNVSGQLRFSDRAIEFTPIAIRKGAQTYKLEGSLRPEPKVGQKQRALYLIDWFLNPVWNLEANVQIPRLELSSMLKKLESKDRYAFPDDWLGSDRIKGSKANLNLDIGSLHWEGEELFSKLLGKFEFDRGRATLRPFSLLHKGGKIKGSATLDLTPVWVRNEDPQWAASVNVEGLDVSAVPFSMGFPKGLVKGDATFTSQGRYYADWEKNARLRGLATLTRVQEDFWTRPIKAKVDAFFDKSEASDYLISDARKNECYAQPETALVEFQKTDDKLDLGRVRVNLKGGGRLDLQADVKEASLRHRARVSGKALYRFPAGCFSVRGQACMKDLQKEVAWPLDFSKQSQVWTDLEYVFDPVLFGKSFQACMEKRVAEDVQKQISAEKTAAESKKK